MKKTLLTTIALLLTAAFGFAQSMNEATELAQAANEAWGNKDFAAAIAGFEKALPIAEACGEEGAELVQTCKTAIPKIAMSVAKEKINAKEYEAGISALKDVIGLAEKYGVDELMAEAESLIPTVEQERVKGLFLSAETLYQEGKLDEALEAFKLAADNGSDNATKRIITILSKKTQAALQAGKLNDAVANFDLLKEADPENANLNSFAYNIAASFYKAKNTAKAKEWFKKLVNDPKYGETAKKMVAAIK